MTKSFLDLHQSLCARMKTLLEEERQARERHKAAGNTESTLISVGRSEAFLKVWGIIQDEFAKTE